MQYGYLVAMIDARLERLQAARTILSTSYDPSADGHLLQAPETNLAQTKKVRPAIRIKKKQTPELSASLFDSAIATPVSVPTPEPVAAVPAQKITARQTVVATTRRAVRELQLAIPSLRRKKAVLPSALTSQAPAAPVFISASQVRENTQKRAEAKVERIPAEQKPSAPLTAEMLAKRWIQSTGF